MRKIVFYSTIAIALLSSLVMVAFAVPPNEWHLNSDYDIRTNYQGIDVPFGAEVTAWAATTNLEVYGVTFHWKNPAGIVVDSQYVDVASSAEMDYDGDHVHVFESKYTPNYIGDGSVQVHFQGEGGNVIHEVINVVAIRAASFNVIPEIPVIGTAGASMAMLIGLGYQLKRRNRNQ